ncbi:MAG: hypothetical protein BWY48_00417 [Parcubacteria group bacterium ADurb.Bin305]|jgi:cell shape-determining protein MreC|nr:MAG: hypothetical protein BWY48_00417 [Parcubacteria group bacterium ADurb.Bin305]
MNKNLVYIIIAIIILLLIIVLASSKKPATPVETVPTTIESPYDSELFPPETAPEVTAPVMEEPTTTIMP